MHQAFQQQRVQHDHQVCAPGQQAGSDTAGQVLFRAAVNRGEEGTGGRDSTQVPVTDGQAGTPTAAPTIDPTSTHSHPPTRSAPSMTTGNTRSYTGAMPHCSSWWGWTMRRWVISTAFWFLLSINTLFVEGPPSAQHHKTERAGYPGIDPLLCGGPGQALWSSLRAGHHERARDGEQGAWNIAIYLLFLNCYILK